MAFAVASDGKQLGLIAELLIDLESKSPELSVDAVSSLARLEAIPSEIGKIKAADAKAVVGDIDDAFKRLQ